MEKETSFYIVKISNFPPPYLLTLCLNTLKTRMCNFTCGKIVSLQKCDLNSERWVYIRYLETLIVYTQLILKKDFLPINVTAVTILVTEKFEFPAKTIFANNLKTIDLRKISATL